MMTCESLKKQLLDKKEAGHFICACGVDQPEQIRSAHEAGADLILFYPTGDYLRVKNRFLTGYLSFDNSNSVMLKKSEEMDLLLGQIHVLAGINASDPFKQDGSLIRSIRNTEFCGIHGYPAMALVDGDFGINLSFLKEGFEKELEFLESAKKEGIFVSAMSRSQKQSLSLARIGVDVITIYLDLGNRKKAGSLSETDIIEQTIKTLKKHTQLIRSVNKNVILLFYSELISSIRIVEQVKIKLTEIDGYLLLPITDKNSNLHRFQSEIRQISLL